MNTKISFQILLNRLLHLKSPRFNSYTKLSSMALFLLFLSNTSYSQGDVYTVPVVVHIIYTDSTDTNIPDNQVYSAIDALNDDFRKAAGTQGDGLGVDTEIEFCLAQRDPQGAATNGIVRYHCVGGCAMGYDTLGLDPAINELSVKSLSQWPNEDYYNIWIVHKFEGDLIGETGYGKMPGGPANLDGSVILYSAFGIGSQYTSLEIDTDLNRTITHEMGHALNLFNTYEGDMDGTTCPANNYCNNDGDQCCDTQPHIRSNGTCVTNNTTCGGTAPVKNYMDNSSEACKSEFTDGQKFRMRSTMENQRLSLLTSLGCEPPCNEITASFSSNSVYYDAPINITFINNSNTSTSIDGYIWYVDGQEVSTDTDLEHSFQYLGFYEVCLDAYNTSCIDRYCEYIYIVANDEGPSFFTCEPSEAIYHFPFNSFSGLPSPPNSPGAETVDPLTNWTDATSTNTPWHCFDPSNSYVGMNTKNGIYEFIETENFVNFEVGKTYKISFDYSAQKYQKQDWAKFIELRLVNGLGQELWIGSQYAPASYPSTAGFYPTSNYFCYPHLYNDDGIDYNLDWRTGTIDYTHTDPSFSLNTNLRIDMIEQLTIGGILEYPPTAGYLDNLTICDCVSQLPEINLDYTVNGCSVDLSIVDGDGNPIPSAFEISWFFLDEGIQEFGNNISHEFNWDGNFGIYIAVNDGCDLKFLFEQITINEDPDCDNCTPTQVEINSQKCGNTLYFRFDAEIPVPDGFDICSGNFYGMHSNEASIRLSSADLDEENDILHIQGDYTLNDPTTSDELISTYITLCNDNGETICLLLEDAISRDECEECNFVTGRPEAICNKGLSTDDVFVYDGSITIDDLPAGYTICDGSADEGQSIYGSYTDVELINVIGNTYDFQFTTDDPDQVSESLILVFCKEEDGKISQFCYRANFQFTVCPRKDSKKGSKSRNNIVGNDIQSEITLEIVENPISNVLRVKHIHNSNNIIELQIADVAGRIIYSGPIKYQSQNSEIDISNYRSGLYYLSISENGRAIDTERFVKF